MIASQTVGTKREGRFSLSLRRNQPCQHPDLGLLALGLGNNKFLLFKLREAGKKEVGRVKGGKGVISAMSSEGPPCHTKSCALLYGMIPVPAAAVKTGTSKRITSILHPLP